METAPRKEFFDKIISVVTLLGGDNSNVFKLAIPQCQGRSLRDYAIYFLTLTFGVCLFYVFNSMDSQQAMTSLNSNQREIIQLLTSAIGYVSILFPLSWAFLVVYSNPLNGNDAKRIGHLHAVRHG